MKIKRKKSRLIMLEKLAAWPDDSDDFDLKFWHKAGVLSRFSAAWGMLRDFYKIKGMHGYKLRLQRTVQNIKQA